MNSTNCNTESGIQGPVPEASTGQRSLSGSGPVIWQVGALCRAVADALDARFNPVAVRGEVSGFSRASSGHCYFSLKDESAQIRCAMFRRVAGLLDFSPRDGQLVELRGRLGVYESRGDLQLIVESMSQAGQGVLFEQFLKLKAKLEAQGLFDALKKRSPPAMPRGIGVVTSPGAAALHDVMTTLQRRVAHIPVVFAPASVQGIGAPAELRQALAALYRLTQDGRAVPPDSAGPDRTMALKTDVVIDVILLVRGGGSAEDLWAFNDEQLAYAIAQSPVPVICGVGHETDFTIADFVADLRAPTPTAAAELVAQPRDAWLATVADMRRRLQIAAYRQIDRHSQQLDLTVSRMGRPSAQVAQRRLQLASSAQRLQFLSLDFLKQRQQDLRQAGLRLGLLDPSLVLQRGYAWLTSSDGRTVSSVRQTHCGQLLQATLADGRLDLTVTDPD
ncbi:MAG: exodeoxyribonuclease VII large subunit [Rhodoferax sp.]